MKRYSLIILAAFCYLLSPSQNKFLSKKRINIQNVKAGATASLAIDVLT